MSTGNKKGYMAKFMTLPNEESVSNAKKTYYMWIIFFTLSFCALSAFLYYKLVIGFNCSDDESLQSNDSLILVEETIQSSKLYNPEPFLAIFRKKIEKQSLGLSCEESQSLGVPLVFVQEILKKDFEDVSDYVYLDILLHYEEIINHHHYEYLKKIFNEYQSKLLSVKSSKDFLNFLNFLKSNKLKFYVSYLKRIWYKVDLKYFERYFALTDELNHWYNYLNKLPEFLMSYDVQKYKMKFKDCSENCFTKFTQETHTKLFRFAYPFKSSDKKLEEVNYILKEWTTSLKVKIEYSSIVFYNKVVLVSEIKEEMRHLNVSHTKTVYVFASHILYLDEDIELPGINLVVISPTWVFLKRTKINVDGIPGKKQIGTGKPGNPGGNAGDLIFIGNFQEKFLVISANGGKGGDGQNGADGRNGSDNTHPDPPIEKPSCLSEISTFNNSFGQKITQYKLYSKMGCGSPGSDGGAGGIGGTGGVITLIGKNFTKISRGLNGISGKPGKGGAGGKGGQNGCFYEVLDVNDEVLHRVTRVRCTPGNSLPSGEPGRDGHNTFMQNFPPVKENLTIHESLLQFAASDVTTITKYDIFPFLNNLHIFDTASLQTVISYYKAIAELGKLKFYEHFHQELEYYRNNIIKETNDTLEYLNAVVLGKILSKKHFNFYLVDSKYYLNTFENQVETLYIKRPKLLIDIIKKITIKIQQLKIKVQVFKNKIEDFILKNSEFLERKKLFCILAKAIDIIQYLIDETPFKPIDLCEKLKATSNDAYSDSLMDAEKIVVYFNYRKDIENQLNNLQTALSSLLMLNNEKLLENFIEHVDNFIALHHLIEWKKSGDLFCESLKKLNLNSNSSENVKFLKKELFDTVIHLNYKLLVKASGRTLYSIMNQSFHNQEKISNNYLLSDVQNSVNSEKTQLCYSSVKAVFDKNSVLKEFFYWPNSIIKNDLKLLFSGAEINLKSSLINHHVFDKNFIQFELLKLDFECVNNDTECKRHLKTNLNNFKIELTHSGYSYYNWKGMTHVVVSEGVNLQYSFKIGENKEPEVYNLPFNKCRTGEIQLSPFTTWTIRLLPLNENANFTKLLLFVDSINLKLVGTGTYLS